LLANVRINGTALKAASDFVKGVESCALCEIAYSGVKEKGAWKQCKASIPVPIEVLYRNKLDTRLSKAAGQEFPIVLAQINGQLQKVLGKDEIESCQGDVESFKALLTEHSGSMPR